MIERLIDWLIAWLTEWLIDWLTDWLIEWLLLTELKKCICISTMRILRNCFTRNKHLSLYPKRRPPPPPPSLPQLSNYNLFFFKNHKLYLRVAVVAGMLFENVKTMRPKRQKRKGARLLHSGWHPLPSIPSFDCVTKQLQFW